MNTIQRLLARMAGLPPAPAIPSSPPSAIWDDTDDLPATKAISYTGGTLSSLWLAGQDLIASPMSYADNSAGWMQASRYNVWVSNCVAARANVMASAPLCLYQKSNDPENIDPEIVTDHPIVILIDRFNPSEDSKSFHKRGARQLAIHGEWYLKKVRGLNGVPVELHRLPAQWVYPHISQDASRIDAYIYQGSQVILSEDMVRTYYPREDLPVYAASPTQTALFPANSYVMADLESQYRDRRGGQGGGIISVDGAAAKDWARIKGEWDSVRSDVRNAGRDAFLPPGATYQSGVLSAQEQQREQRSQRLAKEIMAAFSVPPSLAGDYSDASVLANAAQQSKNFWQAWVLPEMETIAAALNVQLLWADWPETRDKGYYLAFDVSGIQALQPDRLLEAQVDEVYSRIAGQRINDTISTINEAREYLDMEEYKDPEGRADILFAVLKAEITPPPVDNNASETDVTEPASSSAPQDAEASQTPDAMDAMPQGAPATKTLAIDLVGLRATARTGGAALGVIGRVHRFGTHSGIKATKRDPVLTIAGKDYASRDVIILLEE